MLKSLSWNFILFAILLVKVSMSSLCYCWNSSAAWIVIVDGSRPFKFGVLAAFVAGAFFSIISCLLRLITSSLKKQNLMNLSRKVSLSANPHSQTICALTSFYSWDRQWTCPSPTSCFSWFPLASTAKYDPPQYFYQLSICPLDFHSCRPGMLLVALALQHLAFLLSLHTNSIVSLSVY